MSVPEGKATAFNRSPRDTTAVSMVGAGALLPPLWVVGVVLIWLSDNWPLSDKIFATVFAPIATLIAAAVVVFGEQGTIYVAVWIPAALITCFALSFRMGSREARRS